MPKAYKEITLLGQNVNSYGKGLAEKIDFSDLLNLLCTVPGDYQIRFMTSHPKDASRKPDRHHRRAGASVQAHPLAGAVRQ